METIISGRHFDVDHTLREYAEAKISRLVQEYGKLTSARLVMSEERGRVQADAHIYGKHLTLNASAKDEQPRLSIDLAFEKLERQLRRHVERIKDHRGMSLAEAELREAEAATVPDAEADDTEETEGAALKPAN